MEKKEQFDVERQKFQDDPKYKDVKPAAQSGDNDIDRVVAHPDGEAKKETDEAYLQNQSATSASAAGGSK